MKLPKKLVAPLILACFVLLGSGCNSTQHIDPLSSKRVELQVWNSEKGISQKLIKQISPWHEGDDVYSAEDGGSIVQIHATDTKFFVSLMFSIPDKHPIHDWHKLVIRAPDLLYNPDNESPLIASFVMELYGYDAVKTNEVAEVRTLTSTYIFRSDSQEWLLLSRSLYRNYNEVMESQAIWKEDYFIKNEEEEAKSWKEWEDSF